MPSLENPRLALPVAHLAGIAALIASCRVDMRRRPGADAASRRPLLPAGGGLASADVVMAVVRA